MMSSMRDEAEQYERQIRESSANPREKLAAYESLNGVLKKAEHILQGLHGLDATELLRLLIADCWFSPDETGEKKKPDQPHTQIAEAALKAIGYLLRCSTLAQAILTEKAEQAIRLLALHAQSQLSKKMYHLALWALAVQQLPASLIDRNVLKICEVISTGLSGQHVSSAAEQGSLKLLSRMLEQVPSAMQRHLDKWVLHIYRRLVHEQSGIRKIVVRMIPRCYAMVAHVPNTISQSVSRDLQEGDFLAKMMGSAGVRQPAEALVAWSFVVVLLGKTLLSSPGTVNALLRIPQETFVASDPAIRIATYRHWKCLIDTVEKSREGLAHGKRMRLLTHPFKNFLSSEKEIDAGVREVCLESFSYLVQRVSATNSLDSFFLSFVLPILSPVLRERDLGLRKNFYVYLVRLLQPEEEIEWTKPISVLPVSAPLEPEVSSSTTGTFSPLAQISPALIASEKVISFFLLAIEGALLGEDVSEAITEIVLYNLWPILVQKLFRSVDENEGAASIVFVRFFSTFFNILSSPPSVGSLESWMTRCLMLMSGFVELVPPHLLFSNVIRLTVPNHDEEQNLFVALSHFWLSLPAVVPSKMSEFIIAFGELVSIVDREYENFVRSGSAVTLLDMLDSYNSPAARDDGTLLALWSSVAQKLDECLQEHYLPNSVPCTVSVLHRGLLLPVRRILHSSTPPRVSKSILELWGRLYRSSVLVVSFSGGEDTQMTQSAEHSPLVGPLLFMEAICGRINAAMDEKVLWKGEGGPLSLLIHVLFVMSELYDPARSQSIAPRDTEDAALTPMIFGLFGTLLRCSHEFVLTTALEESVVDKLIRSWRHFCAKLYPNEDILPFLSELASLMASWVELSSFSDSSSAEEGAIRTGKEVAAPQMKISLTLIERAVESLFTCVRRCVPVKGKESLAYDSGLLELLSPFLHACFTHSGVRVRNRALSFWQTSFARVRNEPLVYPEALVPVLKMLKDQTAIVLPNWDDVRGDLEPSIGNSDAGGMTDGIADNALSVAGEKGSRKARRNRVSAADGASEGSSATKSLSEKRVSRRKSKTNPLARLDDIPNDSYVKTEEAVLFPELSLSTHPLRSFLQDNGLERGSRGLFELNQTLETIGDLCVVDVKELAEHVSPTYHRRLIRALRAFYETRNVIEDSSVSEILSLLTSVKEDALMTESVEKLLLLSEFSGSLLAMVSRVLQKRIDI